MKRSEIETKRAIAIEMFAAGTSKRDICSALTCSYTWLSTFLPILTHEERTARNKQSALKRHDYRGRTETPEEQRDRNKRRYKAKRRHEIAKVNRWLSRGRQS